MDTGLLIPVVVTAPTTEPVSVAEFKEHANIVGTDNDAVLIPIYITAARKHLEWRTGRTIHQTTYDLFLDDWPDEDPYIELPRATPLVSVTTITYKDSAGTVNTWSSSLYVADTDSVPGRIYPAYGETWPSFTPYPASPIKVRYVAGIATASPIVQAASDIKLATMLLVAAAFENREPELVAPNMVMIEPKCFGLKSIIEQLTVKRAA